MQYPATPEIVFVAKYGNIKINKIVFKDGREEKVEQINGYNWYDWTAKENKTTVHPVIGGCIFKRYDLADIAHFEGEGA